MILLKELSYLKPELNKKSNPAARDSQSSGAGAHKTPKDYSRREKFKKDLRRVEEDGYIPSSGDAKELTITLKVKGDAEKQLAKLLYSISAFCNMGCSRTWGILDGDKGEGPRIGFDGDGADKLIDVKINGKPVKEYVPAGKHSETLGKKVSED